MLGGCICLCTLVCWCSWLCDCSYQASELKELDRQSNIDLFLGHIACFESTRWTLIATKATKQPNTTTILSTTEIRLCVCVYLVCVLSVCV